MKPADSACVEVFVESRTYRLLFFRSSRLVKWRELEASDHLDAIAQASNHADEDLVELWHCDKQIAIFGPPLTRRYAGAS